MSEAAPNEAAQQSRNARLLFTASAAGVAAACAYYGFTAKVQDPLHLYQGLIILVLATLPAVLWARKGGSQLPLFEVLMLTGANTYALPLLSGGSGLGMFEADTISFTASAVILYQGAALTTYYMVQGFPGRSKFFTDEVIARDINRYVGLGLVATTIYTFISTFFDVLPRDLVGVLRAVFYGVGLVSVFVQARRWGLGELPPAERSMFIVNMAVQIIIQFSTLFLVGGISILVLALVGYVSGSRRLPFLVVTGALGLIALLHNGKGDMRNIYWEIDGYHRQPSLTELPAFFAEWVQWGLNPTVTEDAEQKMTNKLLERTSLFHILCLVASRTPDPLPYLGGETYADIPGQFVPRFFWPDKPVGHVSTYTLSIYYGLQRAEDTSKTTIGFGTVSEAYANFGMFGVGLLGCFYGFFYKRVQTLSINSPLLSYAGLLQIVLMAWSFQTEFPMSMWLSSMFQACVAVMGLPFMIRNLFG